MVNLLSAKAALEYTGIRAVSRRGERQETGGCPLPNSNFRRTLYQSPTFPKIYRSRSHEMMEPEGTLFTGQVSNHCSWRLWFQVCQGDVQTMVRRPLSLGAPSLNWLEVR